MCFDHHFPEDQPPPPCELCGGKGWFPKDVPQNNLVVRDYIACPFCNPDGCDGPPDE